MKRRIFNLLAALSLLPCAATVVMWVRSYGHADAITGEAPRASWVAYLCRGGIGLMVQPCVVKGDWSLGGVHRGDSPVPYGTSPGPAQWSWLGIEYGSFFTSNANDEWSIAVPSWILTALSALPMLLLSLARGALRRRLRSKPGTCPVCGYDLRAMPDRCPECGTAVPAPKPAEANA